MRVTITKTIELEKIPSEINEGYRTIRERVDSVVDILSTATSNAEEGRYVSSAEEMEKLRIALAILDKNIEEQQSLCLSYEKIRIQTQMPEQQQAPTGAPIMDELNHEK